MVGYGAVLRAAKKLTGKLGQVVFQLLKLGYDSNNGNYFAWIRSPASAW